MNSMRLPMSAPTYFIDRLGRDGIACRRLPNLRESTSTSPKRQGGAT